MYTKCWKRLSVCASTCMPLKQCIWCLGQATARSCLDRCTPAGPLFLGTHTPFLPFTHFLSFALLQLTSLLALSPHAHRDGKPLLRSGYNLPVWIWHVFVIGGCLGSNDACSSPSGSVHQTTRTWQRGAKNCTAWGFLGSRVSQRGDIIESISRLRPFSAPLTLHLVNILCHAPFGVTDATVTGAAFIWHCFGWLCQYLQRLPF